jgi:hypothetical protein
MNPIFKIITANLLILLSNVCEADSLCKTTEKVIFSCTVQNGKKILSICSSTKLTKTEGYLQYRFGAKSKIELVYPSTTKDTQEKFSLRYLRGSEGAGGELSFENYEYEYTVSTSHAYDNNSVNPEGVSGYVQITKKGKSPSQYNLIKCDGVPDGDLYNLLQGVVDEYW